MMGEEQLDLLNQPPPFPNREPIARAVDPSTSHAAANLLTAGGARSSQKVRVMSALRVHPGVTSAELAQLAGLDRYVVARRLPDLREDGFVAVAQARRCTVTGMLALTWVPVPR